jgi:hypothetical protein
MEQDRMYDEDNDGDVDMDGNDRTKAGKGSKKKRGVEDDEPPLEDYQR